MENNNTSEPDLDSLFEKGSLLLSNEMLVDSPAGSGQMYIFHYGNEFFATDDSQILAKGKELEDVKEMPMTIFPGKATLKSTHYKADELADLLNVDRLNEGDCVTINELEYRMHSGKLLRD